MSKLTDLKQKFEDTVAQMDEITSRAEAEMRDVSAEEQENFDKLDAECESLNQKIKAEEALLKRRSQLEAGRVPPSPGRTVPPPRPESSTPTPTRDHLIQIPASVKRWGNLKSFKGPAGDVQAYKAGQFYSACLGNARAKAWLADHGLDIEAAAQREGVNTAGGYLVYDELDNAIIDLRDEYGVFTRNARRVAMTSDVTVRPRRTGGLTAYFVGEDTAITESNKDWDKVQLITKKLGAIARVTNELSEDAIISVADDLTQEIAWAFAKKIDECGFVGTGAAVAYGGIKGVTQRLSDVNGVDDGGGLVLSANNTMADFTAAEIGKLISILPAYAARRAKFYCSSAVNGQVFDRLKIAGGGNAVSDIEGKVRHQFMGYPVELTEVMPKTDVNSQLYILFGDLALAADFGDRRQTTVKVSDSAYIGSVSVFERDETAIVGTTRFDINVHDVGTSSAAGPIVALIGAAA
jgi:HK97 family phage major capsid protein